ncbi:MAG: cytochrome P450 [Archangiaceae bacterium]|nr:cytochrome P450 [Archangiaceae bacterium]
MLAGRAAVALADLPRLDLTRRTFEETLRLYPSAYVVGRRALAADRLGGYRIGPGESVFMSSAITGRDRRYWDDPSTFDPDRFLPGRSAGRPAMACFPFGGGPRKCLGDTFATMELQVIGAMLARRFELELVSGQHLEVDPQLSLRPRHGVSIKVRRRDDLRLESTR